MLSFIASLLFVSFQSPVFSMTLDSYLNGPPIFVDKGNFGENVMKDTDWSKFQGILDRLTQPNYGCVIKQASEIYGIDPIAIMGSIIGEHTYNVDDWDVWGERYLYMRKKWITRFEGNGINIQDLLSEDQYKNCETLTGNNYDLWNCYDSVWKKDSRNDRRSSKNSELKWTFFNPIGSGYTYGLGQLGPERALMVTDYVSATSGFEKLSLDDPRTLYDHILNPQMSIHYVAATNKIGIEIYLETAHFDISNNPGVIATLYNLGRERKRAEEKYQETINNLNTGLDPIPPMSNYYGWLINLKEDEIRQAYHKKIEGLSNLVCQEFLL